MCSGKCTCKSNYIGCGGGCSSYTGTSIADMIGEAKTKEIYTRFNDGMGSVSYSNYEDPFADSKQYANDYAAAMIAEQAAADKDKKKIDVDKTLKNVDSGLGILDKGLDVFGKIFGGGKISPPRQPEPYSSSGGEGKILGMPKMVFVTLILVVLVIIGLVVWSRSKKK